MRVDWTGVPESVQELCLEVVSVDEAVSAREAFVGAVSAIADWSESLGVQRGSHAGNVGRVVNEFVIAFSHLDIAAA